MPRLVPLQLLLPPPSIPLPFLHFSPLPSLFHSDAGIEECVGTSPPLSSSSPSPTHDDDNDEKPNAKQLLPRSQSSPPRKKRTSDVSRKNKMPKMNYLILDS